MFIGYTFTHRLLSYFSTNAEACTQAHHSTRAHSPAFRRFGKRHIG
uniref:Uncharacterized protein n=1 Tax=Anguilla anguilla TaxID=7936 RepID=A0A0E9QVE2_ANGAN